MTPIAPAPRLGIVGGGQLGRMLALAALNLGVRSRVLDQTLDGVAGHVCHVIATPFDALAPAEAAASALHVFAAGLDAVTYEFENVPVALAELLAQRVPVRPGPAALAASQDRLVEKRLLQSLGIATAQFAPVATAADAHDAADALGLPIILKTRRGGYDGKGQVIARQRADVHAAFATLAGHDPPPGALSLGHAGLIAEALVPFERELSIVAARGLDGQCAFYPVVENLHARGILRLTRAPAPGLTPALQAAAESIARRLMVHLGYVGVLCVELFQRGSELIANEFAPRVHNSGHWSMDFAHTGQFENHVRAVLGMPLGDTALIGRPAFHDDAAACAMINLIGDIPDAQRLAALREPGARLHDYGKAPRPGRKLGHINILAPDPQALNSAITRLRAHAPPI